VIVSPKPRLKKIEKDAHWAKKSKSQKKKKLFPRNKNQPISRSIFILSPRNIQKSISQPYLHLNLTYGLFFQSRSTLGIQLAFLLMNVVDLGQTKRFLVWRIVMIFQAEKKD